MKTFAITILSLLVSAQAYSADVSFLSGNQMPASLKQKLRTALIEQCGAALEIGNIFFENQTTVVRDQVDQGVVDHYYTTEFLIASHDDLFHFDSYTIVVKSVQMAGSNPSPDDYGLVESITSADNLCK